MAVALALLSLSLSLSLARAHTHKHLSLSLSLSLSHTHTHILSLSHTHITHTHTQVQASRRLLAARSLLGVRSAGLQASKVLASSSSSASLPSSASVPAANVPGDLLQNERERHAHLRQSDKGVPAANKDVSAPNTVPKRTRPNGVPLKPVPLSHAGSPMSKVPLQLQASFPSRAVGGVGGGQRGGGGGGGAGVMGGGERAATGGGGLYGGLSMGGAGFKAVAAALKPTAEQSLFLKSVANVLLMCC